MLNETPFLAGRSGGKGDKFKKGYGISHIIAKRNAETGNGIDIAYKMVEVVAKATEASQQSNDFPSPENTRLKLFYDNSTAVLTKSLEGNHWLLTGWDNKIEAAAYADGEVSDSSTATAAKPIQRKYKMDDVDVAENVVVDLLPVIKSS